MSLRNVTASALKCSSGCENVPGAICGACVRRQLCKRMGVEAPVKRTFASNLKGKQAVFCSWLSTNPFVSSFVEDLERGTAKETRVNTLVNREIRADYRRTPDSVRKNSKSIKNAKSSREMDNWRRKTRHQKVISFNPKVKVHSADTKQKTTFEDVKDENRNGNLEMRRMKQMKTYVDVRLPTTAAGKWLLRRTSSNAHETLQKQQSV